MGLRIRAFLIGVVLAFNSSLTAALGLGEIKLNSALNQPLDAEIQLLHVRELSEREIIIGLAPADDFQRAGVDRIYFLSALKFRVDLGASGGPVVKLTTTEPVKEPFLDFIVTAQWPSGKLLREYTLLVDLPIYTEGKVAPVKGVTVVSDGAATKTNNSTRAKPNPASSASRQSAVATPKSDSYASSSEEYGPVGANESLWSIARKLRPDAEVSVQQTMLAIQRLNPEAFINGNINLLRRGQVLRVPDKNEIAELSSRDAIREVAAQNSAWKNGGKASSAQLEGSKSVTAANRETTAVEGRVKLSSEELKNPNGGGSGKGKEGVAAIESQLAVSQEELDAARRENSDLKSRITAVEDQMKTMEKLLEVSNDEMRAIELAAKQTNSGSANSVAETELAASDSQPQTPAQQPDEAQPVKPEVAKTAPEAPVNVNNTQAKKTWMDMIQENVLIIAGCVGALVILLGAVLFLRNRKDDFDDYDDEFAPLPDDFEAKLDVVQEPVDDARESVDEGDASVDLDFDEPQEEVFSEAETEDVVGECDIHLAYGQYDQAEEKLLRALEREPRNVAVRMKLLEVFAAQNDVEGFDSHYAKVRVLGDSESVERAELLRGSIDDVVDFDESRYDVSEFLSKLNEDYETTGEELFAKEEGGFEADDNLDFAEEDDTLQFVSAEDEFSVELDEESPTDKESLSLDFELDTDDDITRIPKETTSEDDFADDVSGELNVSSDHSNFDDVEFDLDYESDTELASGDLDLGGELDALEDEVGDLNFNFDEELPAARSEKIPSDFAESFNEDDLASESDEFALAADDFAVGDLDEDLLANSDTDTSEIDFDLEKDLESAIASENKIEASLDLEGNEGLDFDDLETVGLDDLDSEDLLSAADGELDLDDALDDTVIPNLSTNDADDAIDLALEPEAGADFDVDYDLEEEVNLDDFDQELEDLGIEDLASDEADVGSLVMEEPEVDFEELDLEPEVELELASEDAVELLEPELEAQTADESSTESADLNFQIPDFDPENDDDSNLEFLSDNDETATKLDLARAYIDMGDADGAKDILDEIAEEGNEQQKKEAEVLLRKLA